MRPIYNSGTTTPAPTPLTLQLTQGMVGKLKQGDICQLPISADIVGGGHWWEVVATQQGSSGDVRLTLKSNAGETTITQVYDLLDRVLLPFGVTQQ